jgi:hypothetical protein
MVSSLVSRQTEKVLEDILQTIRQEYEDRDPVLCEADRNKFVEEERMYGVIFLLSLSRC